jgi:diaminopimelate decarboxylase
MTNSITPLRISPGVTPDTHPSIATGHGRSKFGLPASATATDRLIERMLARGSVRLRGIHMHLGLQIRDLYGSSGLTARGPGGQPQRH